MPGLAVLAHHSEPSDPRLLRGVIETLESLLGLGPAIVIIPVTVFVVAFPIMLASFALRPRRRQLNVREIDDDRDGRLAK